MPRLVAAQRARLLAAAAALACVMVGVGAVFLFYEPPMPPPTPAARGDGKQPLEEAFAQAATLPSGHYAWVVWTEMDAQAERLAADYGAAAVPFLTGKLASRPPESMLARLTLAKLAADPAVADALPQDPRVPGAATPTHLAVHFPTAARRRYLVARLDAGPSVLDVRLAEAVGDANALARLERLDTRGDQALAAAVQQAVATLRQRLALPVPAEQEARATEHLNLLRADLDPDPGFRNLTMDPIAKAEVLHRNGQRYTAAFLKERLAAGSGDTAATAGETALGMAFAGLQREAGLEPELLRLAEGTGSTAEYAVGALSRIGTEEAIRGLEGLLAPQPARVNRNQDIAAVLSRGGDARSLAVLAQVKDDPRYTESDRSYLTRAHNQLRDRLRGPDRP